MSSARTSDGVIAAASVTIDGRHQYPSGAGNGEIRVREGVMFFQLGATPLKRRHRFAASWPI
jgi:hypothetical protein